jgi:hypothetical protein
VNPRVRLSLQQIGLLIAMLGQDADEDERLLVDAIEGETDAFETIGKLLEAIEHDEGQKAALTSQIASRDARIDRCDVRISAQRAAIAMIMTAARLKKVSLPEATVSLGETKSKLAINAADAVPAEYTTTKVTPSMDAIKAVFSPDSEDLPNWLRVEPARPSLTIRRK